MNNKLYVGNLPYTLSDDELKEAFDRFGEVLSAKIIIDRETQRSKGFGFVEMSTEAEADNALSEMNGADLGGRSLKVDKARPPRERDRRPRGRDNYSRY